MYNKIVRFILGAVFIFGLTPALAKKSSSSKIPTIKRIGGKKTMDLSQYKGKPVLITNIATQCGYTPQLEGLESVYKKFKGKGLVVIGIPSNDFGGQTPEDEEGVKKFCKINYGVSFPLTAKTVVKGDKKHPLISHLLSQSDNKDEIAWNFEKFLLDKEGKVVGRYKSSVKPESKEITEKITSLL
jgi:glutathione peroxidase